MESDKESNLAFLRVLLRLGSAGSGALLATFSCLGFGMVHRMNGIESQTTFACLCFLGMMLGTILCLAEGCGEWFFFYFGFLRFRIGRAILFFLSGTLSILVGVSSGKSCNCSDFTSITFIGIACEAAGLGQLLGTCVFGNTVNKAKKNTSGAKASTNNTVQSGSDPAAAGGSKGGASSTSRKSSAKWLVSNSSSTSNTETSGVDKAEQGRSEVPPATEKEQNTHLPPTPPAQRDPNLPSWMYE